MMNPSYFTTAIRSLILTACLFFFAISSAFAQGIDSIASNPEKVCAGSRSDLTAFSPADSVYWFHTLQSAEYFAVTASGASTPVFPVADAVYYAGTSPIQASDSALFGYTGTVQTFTVPAGVHYLVYDIGGAEGGHGKKGKRLQGTYPVTPGTVLNLYIGGTTLTTEGGWNGGAGIDPALDGYCWGGGGATDIRIGGDSLANRVIVAGGGAGGGNYGGGGGGWPTTGVSGHNIENGGIAQGESGQSYSDSTTIWVQETSEYVSGNGYIKLYWSTLRLAVGVKTSPVLTTELWINANYNNVCEGTLVTYTAYPSNQGLAPHYQWFVNGNPAGPDAPVFSYQPQNGDVIKCMMMSSEECVTEDSLYSNEISMQLTDGAVALVQIGGETHDICAGTAFYLYYDVNYSYDSLHYEACNPLSIKWLRNGVVIDSTSMYWIFFYSTSLEDAGDYTCVVCNPLGCDTSNVWTMNVHEVPTPGTIGVQLLDSLEVLVTYTGDTSSAYEYSWNFATGTVQSGSDAGPYHIRYLDGDFHQVSLSVATNYCSSPTIYSSKFRVQLYTDVLPGLHAIDYGTMEFGDYNNDGLLDVLATGSGVSKVYKNAGNDTVLANPAVLPALTYSTGIWLDFNNDNFLDFIMGGYNGTHNIMKLYLNNGDETFSETGHVFEGLKAPAIKSLDYNNDGYIDLIMSGADNAGHPQTILYKNCSGSAFQEIEAGILDLMNGSIACADYNKDGYTDFIIQGDDSITRYTRIYKNVDGSFNEVNSSILNLNKGGLDWGDYDKDGDLDVVVSGLNAEPWVSGSSISFIDCSTLRIYRNDGNETFTQSVDWSGSRKFARSDLEWGDYDNDGDLDLFAIGHPGIASAYVGMGGGTIDPNIPRSAPRLWQNQGGDQFMDAAADIPRCITADSYQSFCVWSDYVGYSITLGDYNNDNIVDVLRTGNGGRGFVSTIYRNEIPVSNEPPDEPLQLQSSVFGNKVTLEWAHATDDHTPYFDLAYKTYIKNEDDEYVISKVNSNYTYNTTSQITDLSPGQYTWSVRSRDGATILSDWAEEQTFFIADTLIFLCAGDTLMLNEKPYYSPGFYADTLLSHTGADSIWFFQLCHQINQPQDIHISGPLAVCQGTLNKHYVVSPAIPGSIYHWSFPAGVSGEDSANTCKVAFGPTATSGSIVVLVINSCGDSIQLSLPVTVNPTPVLAMAPETDICAGQTTTLHVDGAWTYLWSTGKTVGPEYSGHGFLVITPTSDAVYSVTGTSSKGCTSSASINVDVWAATPQAPAQILGDTSICQGETMVFSVPDDTLAHTYEWLLPQGASGSSDSNSIHVQFGSSAISGNISVRLSNACGQSTYINQWLDVKAVPVAGAINGPEMLCSGQTNVSYSVQALPEADTYVWSLPPGVSGSGSTNSLDISVPDSSFSGEISVYGINRCGAGPASTINLSVDTIRGEISGPGTYCGGQAIQLTASGGQFYLWSTGETTQSIEVAPTEATDYVVTITLGACTRTIHHTVSVGSTNFASISGESSICMGQSLELTGNGGTTFNWSSGQTTPSIVVMPAGSTTYSVTATNSIGCTSMASHQVVVNPVPAVTISGTNAICQGTDAFLHVNDIGMFEEFQWNTGEPMPFLMIQPISTTTYSLTVTDFNGCTASTSHTVVVYPNPPASITGPASICQGESALLTASGGNNYQWNTGGTGSFVSVSPSASTTYEVTVTDLNGCGAINSHTVAVNPNPLASITGPAAICQGESALLTASGGNTYQWNTGGMGSTVNVSPSASTTYQLTVTAANGCTSTTSHMLTVNPPPVATATGSTVVCEGATATIYAIGGISYHWNNGANGSLINVNPTTTTTYLVTVTGSNGCTASTSHTVAVNPNPLASITGPAAICQGESATISACGGNTYQWSTGATGSSVSVSPSTSTTYQVTVSNAYGCSSTTSQQLSVNPPPVVSITGPASICEGGNALLTASGGNTYLWNTGGTESSVSVSPSTSTNYQVTVSDANGCSGTTSYQLLVNPPPVVSITGPTSICEGESALLTTSGGSTYQWSTGSTESSVSVSPSTTTNYQVTVNDAYGCSSTTSLLLTVNPSPVLSITGPASICQGESATLSASEGATYSWSTGGTGSSVIVNPLLTTMYYVTISTIEGCSSADSIEVVVKPIPATPVITYDGVMLHSTAAEGNQWYNEDGPISGSVFQDYYASSDGNYFVMVEADGCWSDTSNIINITFTTTAESGPGTNIMVYPNPVTDKLFLLIDGSDDLFVCELYDAHGKFIFTKRFSHRMTIETDHLAPGNYYVVIRSEGIRHVEKIIVN